MNKITFIFGLLGMCVIITTILICLTAGTDIDVDAVQSQQLEEQHRIESLQAECEHDWVVTSKYDFIWRQFRTISKCSKCGKEIE